LLYVTGTKVKDSSGSSTISSRGVDEGAKVASGSGTSGTQENTSVEETGSVADRYLNE
jgi:hypothetical protein